MVWNTGKKIYMKHSGLKFKFLPAQLLFFRPNLFYYSSPKSTLLPSPINKEIYTEQLTLTRQHASNAASRRHNVPSLSRTTDRLKVQLGIWVQISIVSPVASVFRGYQWNRPCVCRCGCIPEPKSIRAVLIQSFGNPKTDSLLCKPCVAPPWKVLMVLLKTSPVYANVWWRYSVLPRSDEKNSPNYWIAAGSDEIPGRRQWP
jgi:hypothetical protein